jgi:hypothetical protein
LVKYSDSKQGRQALKKFHKAYLPDYERNFIEGSMIESPNFFNIEDGWLGYKLQGPFVALVFECPDQKSAQNILKQILINLKKMEDNHGE